MVAGLGRQAAGRGELGSGLQHTGEDGGEGKVAHPAAAAVENAFQSKLAAEAEEDGDMAMGQGAANGEGVVEGVNDDSTNTIGNFVFDRVCKYSRKC